MVSRAKRLLSCLALITCAAQAQQPHPLLTGYFPQWGLYNDPQYTVKNLAENAGLLDQINYAQGFVTGGHCSVADPNADTNYAFTAAQSVDGVADSPTQPLRGSFNQMIKLKRRHPHLKLVLSLEGKAADFAFDAQPENRAAFVASCVHLWIKGTITPEISIGTLFDGIDIDWEFPHPEDAANYIELLKEFRRQMDAVRPGMLLNVAVGPSPRMMGGADMAIVASLVDQMGLMTYDFTGPWVQHTGFVSALSGEVGSGTVTHTVSAYRAAGVPAAKLLVGVPFYGYGWRLVPEDNNGLFQEGEPIHGDRPYREIETKIPTSRVYRDPNSQAPWLFDGDVFWTYEDPISVSAKARYAAEQSLGGLMIWELGEDNATATLLTTAHKALHEEPTPITNKQAQ
ncbi:chitinase [Granulicella pectinivorans]|jgi:chitinase|uniref:chitinase n=1 Tax=Granulicella pectinivorans TaxID=474950 RepID=A0A1I6MSR8_9BACT|nr:glycosyl hydrolase family 18 protein [Granulicella pectinivorans]SFS18568.1 chitinase [Granulicella pectinivorans]